jgi:hypothetical protein
VKFDNLFFADVEARGVSPVRGTMTEFGVVHYVTGKTFHGVLFRGRPDPANPAVPLVGEQISTAREEAERLALWTAMLHRGRATLVSDNPAYDFMWIAGMFDEAGLDNPFGHSGRRISDFYAGLTGDWLSTQEWKRYRRTVHDHNPVHDAQGNAEAFAEILRLHAAGELAGPSEAVCGACGKPMGLTCWRCA